MTDERILVIGYGNPARGDDGLGPALAAAVESMAVPGVTVETDYQLAIEHGALAAEHDVVVFADAARDAEAPFYFRSVTPSALACTSHAVTPGQVLAIAAACFGAAPQAYVLGMRARTLDGFEEQLSGDGRDVLAAASAFLRQFIDGRRNGSAAAARSVGLEPGDL